MPEYRIIQSDCLEVLPTLEAGSIIAERRLAEAAASLTAVA